MVITNNSIYLLRWVFIRYRMMMRKPHMFHFRPHALKPLLSISVGGSPWNKVCRGLPNPCSWLLLSIFLLTEYRSVLGGFRFKCSDWWKYLIIILKIERISLSVPCFILLTWLCFNFLEWFGSFLLVFQILTNLVLQVLVEVHKCLLFDS